MVDGLTFRVQSISKFILIEITHDMWDLRYERYKRNDKSSASSRIGGKNNNNKQNEVVSY